MLATLIRAAVVSLVLYLIYILVGLIAHGVILTITFVILVLVFIAYLLKAFGINI